MDDERLKEAFRSVSLDEQSEARIWAAIEAQAPPGKENRSVKTIKTPLRVALIAAILSVLMIGTAYAAFGVPRFTATKPMAGEGHYTKFADLPAAEKTLGFPVRALEEFGNGYAFRDMDLRGEGVYDEESNLLRDYYSLTLRYEKSEEPELTVSIVPILDLPEQSSAPEPSETRMFDGIELHYSRDYYKFVPEDYEKTPEDLAAEATGHFYISFGADRVTEVDFSSVSFTLDGAEYTLMTEGLLSADTLCAMAGELIAAHDR